MPSRPPSLLIRNFPIPDSEPKPKNELSEYMTNEHGDTPLAICHLWHIPHIWNVQFKKKDFQIKPKNWDLQLFVI